MAVPVIGRDARVPPHDLEAEASVLGAILLDPAAIMRILDFLNPQDFYRENHGQIYRAALSLFREGEPIDSVTIAGNSVLHGHTSGQTVVLEYGRPGPGGEVVPSGRLVPYDLNGEQPKAWRNLRFARSQMPADAVAVRVVAEDAAAARTSIEGEASIA